MGKTSVEEIMAMVNIVSYDFAVRYWARDRYSLRLHEKEAVKGEAS